jgi:hypothetical protein
LLWGPWNIRNSCTYAHARPRCVLAGGEVAGREEPVGQGLRNLENTVGLNVHDGQQWNGANDEEVRRP